jgi:hypothetical protein
MANAAALRKGAHHEEDIDPSEDDLGRGEYLKVIVRIIVIRQHVETPRGTS